MTKEQKWLLLITSIGSFLTPFTSSASNIALPAIEKDFTMNAVTLSWIASSFLLAAAVFLVPIGRIADIYGKKRVYHTGLAILAGASLLITVAPSVPFLLAFRVIQGIGSAMLFGTGVALLTSVFPAAERGKVLGINVAVTYLGLSLGPVLGGFLTLHFGWRSIFWVNAGLAGLNLGLVLGRMKREWIEAAGEAFDLAGSLLYGAALFCLIFGASKLPQAYGAWLSLAGVAGIAGFGFWESRVQHPILNINLFHGNRVFVFSSLAALINYSATFAVSFLLSLYLQYIKGFNPQTAGLVLLVQPMMQVIFSPVAGRLSDRIEPQKLASLGMFLTSIGLLLLVAVDAITGMPYIVISLLILGTGYGLFSSPNTNAFMSSVERRFYGVASGILGTMRLTGQIFSMGITALIFALYIGNVRIVPANYPTFLASLKTIFMILTALCVAGIFASYARGRLRGE